MNYGKRKKKKAKGLITTQILQRAIPDPSIPTQAFRMKSRIIFGPHSFHSQDLNGDSLQVTKMFAISFFVSPSPLIWFSSNFESGGEESALLVLFIMEIDLTLICIYLHRHQADLETEGGCNLLWSWQICSKNSPGTFQPALKNLFSCPFDFCTTWAEFQRNTPCGKEKKGNLCCLLL